MSWSGTRSRLIARELSAWLKDVFQGIETWMSEADIKAGARWADKLSEELQRSNFAVSVSHSREYGISVDVI